MSGYTDASDIYYERSWRVEGRSITMEWVYPAEMQDQMGPAIETAEDTFRASASR